MTNPPPGVDKMLEFLRQTALIPEKISEVHCLEDYIAVQSRDALAAYNPDDWEKVQELVACVANPWNLTHEELCRFEKAFSEHSLKHGHGYYESTVYALRQVYKGKIEALPQSSKDWALGGGNK